MRKLTENDRAAIEVMLNRLREYDFTVEGLLETLRRRTESNVPPDEALPYVITESSVVEHLLSCTNGTPPTVALNNLVSGYSYILTPGQREWLKRHYDMTPSEVILITEVECWPDTWILRSFKLESMIHTDPRNRRHVLTQARVTEGWRFFKESAVIDAEKEEAQAVKKRKESVNLSVLDNLLQDLMKE